MLIYTNVETNTHFLVIHRGPNWPFRCLDKKLQDISTISLDPSAHQLVMGRKKMVKCKSLQQSLRPSRFVDLKIEEEHKLETHETARWWKVSEV